MGSVHASTRPSLPITAATTRAAAADGTTATDDASDDIILTDNTVQNTFDGMGNVTAQVLRDVGTVSGFASDDPEAGYHLNGGAIAGGVAVGGGISAVAGLAREFNKVSEANNVFKAGDILPGIFQGGPAVAASAGLKITPTLVSAIIGPAAADGITAIAPNLVKKKIDVSKITDAAEKKKATANNQWSTYSRIVAGGVVVGAVALGVFLLKPDLFKKFGTKLGIDGGLVTQRTLQGTTHVITSRGNTEVLKGLLSGKAEIAAGLAGIGKALAKGETAQVVKTVGASARSASTSWRAVIGVTGGVGTLLLANKAAGAEGDEKQHYAIAAAAVGAATIGAFGATGAVVRALEGKGGAAKAITGFKPLWGPGKVELATEVNGLPGWIKKINWQWFKNYGAIAGITAVPAGTAAGQYYNIFNGDLDTITKTGSPWRK
ncbi:MAG: hypothetical protein JWN72_1828 [Thermoleophilia bacterium]|nr:hypothetical protein [Thermoleophilia bacterium]